MTEVTTALLNSGNEVDQMSVDQWISLMQRLGIGEHLEMYAVLKEKYAENHRYYHTLEHIKFCLTLFESHRHLAKYPEEVELAIWFHDAVYNIFSSTNERDSARLASEFLLSAGLGSDVATRVSELIMATLHGTPLSNSDQALIVDVDLSVLGCSHQSYKEFEVAIRKEYRKIPFFLYKQGRKKILNSFLQKERIYSFPEFYQKYEFQARENMKNAINTL